MSGGLVPRSQHGSAPRLIEGPKIGQRSLYQQQVLDEDTYTDALSHIITRDFFPHLPHMHATNDYLTALTNNDPELLSASIRRLAALAQEKEQEGVAGPSRRGRAGQRDEEGERARRRELENVGTPYISLPGQAGKAPLRTPVGVRGWDTPDIRDSASAGRARREAHSDGEADLDSLAGDLGLEAGPSRPNRKRRKQDKDRLLQVRDDLSLDAFQRNYTSEDNASFVQIVDEENKKRKEERWAWAWEAEKRANMRRIEGEDRRRLLLEGTKDGVTVDGTGRRLIGGLAEPGRDREQGEAWKEPPRLITAPLAETGSEPREAGDEGDTDGALIKHSSTSTDGALITSTEASSSRAQTITAKLAEVAVPANHPLAQALTSAGLPATALVSVEDGALVPARETTSGAGEGRGRGSEERDARKALEKEVMGEEEREYLALAGSGGDMWGYKTRNNFFFPADANTDPYPKSRPGTQPDDTVARAAHQAPKEINYANTRLPDEEEVGLASSSKAGSARRGSSPARSWVDAAVTGTPYRPHDSMPSVNNYPLLPTEPSPSPQDLPSLLTWGTLLSTPRALDGSGSSDPLDADPSGRKFRLPETSRRDTLGRRLADKASRAMNERARSFTPRASSGSVLSAALRSAADKTVRGTPGRKGGEMGPPAAGSMTPRASGLTPAGRMLLDRSLGRTPAKGGFGVGAGRRGQVMEKAGGWGGAAGGSAKKEMGWTPSPARKK